MGNWAGKQVALIGLGRSNLAVARYLVAQKAIVTACDKKSAGELGSIYDELTVMGVQCRLGPKYLRHLTCFDTVFVAPGVPKNLPDLVAAREAGVRFSSEVNLFFELCRASIVGVTGSSGKTTTSTMIGEILTAGGLKTVVGGNMGRPLLEQAPFLTPDSWVVLELSSFQLEMMDKSPHISLMTNIAPDHLDIHADMADYIAAKSNIYKHQRPTDWAVFNADNAYTRQMAEEAPGRIAWFSTQRIVERGACIVDDRVMLSKYGALTEICPVKDISDKLMGKHNVENVLAAVAIADLVGSGPSASQDVVTSFTGVAHRLEFVRSAEGISYYNDSIATTPVEAAAGLRSFSSPVILIAGGKDKNLPWDEFCAAVSEHAKAVVLIGAAQAKIADALKQHSGASDIPVLPAASLGEAVATARSLAAPGDVILLSPACASFDMFANFEERGERFRELVWAMTEANAPALS